MENYIKHGKEPNNCYDCTYGEEICFPSVCNGCPWDKCPRSKVEPCEDAISRADALTVAYAYCPDDDGSCTKAGRDLRELLDEIEDIPPVAPSRPSGEWIPCEERLPSVYQKAVVCNIHGEMMIGAYTEFGWMFPCYFEKPIAWMPLPEPYKESE